MKTLLHVVCYLVRRSGDAGPHKHQLWEKYLLFLDDRGTVILRNLIHYSADCSAHNGNCSCHVT